MKLKHIATIVTCTAVLVGLFSTVGCDDKSEATVPNDPAGTPVPEPNTDGPEEKKEGN
jgi:hypothetical protein